MGMQDSFSGISDNLSTEGKTRIVQELVPGKQITIAHLIANPDKVLYEKLGLDPSVDYSRSAIGVLTISPAETAVIAADIAVKAASMRLAWLCGQIQRNAYYYRNRIRDGGFPESGIGIYERENGICHMPVYPHLAQRLVMNGRGGAA